MLSHSAFLATSLWKWAGRIPSSSLEALRHCAYPDALNISHHRLLLALHIHQRPRHYISFFALRADLPSSAAGARSCTSPPAPLYYFPALEMSTFTPFLFGSSAPPESANSSTGDVAAQPGALILHQVILYPTARHSQFILH